MPVDGQLARAVSWQVIELNVDFGHMGQLHLLKRIGMVSAQFNDGSREERLAGVCVRPKFGASCLAETALRCVSISVQRRGGTNYGESMAAGAGGAFAGM